MKLTFLGTRGGIKARSKRHYRHTVTLVEFRGKRVLLDCGADWVSRIHKLDLDAIVLTHAHPDHVDGLKKGAPCVVWATDETWQRIHAYSIKHVGMIEPQQPVDIAGMTFEAFSLEHSIHAPAVGYRITAGKRSIFYVPDVVDIHDKQRALEGIDLYVGDGAIITRTLLVRKKDHSIGHAPIREQITWCQDAGVSRAIFTHCGTEITMGDSDEIDQKLTDLGAAVGMHVQCAYDGMEVTVEG